MVSGKNSTLTSIVKLAFRVDSVYLTIFSIIVIFNGVWEPVNLVVMQHLIDQILAMVQEHQGLGRLVPLFSLLIGLQVYKNFLPTGERLLALKFCQRVQSYFWGLVIDKIPRIEYQHIEKKETYDLIHRVKQGAKRRVSESLEHVGKIITGLISVLGLFLIIWQAGWWISLGIFSLLGVTAFLAYKCGTRTFQMSVMQSKVEREMEYYGNLFTDRTTAPEMKLFGAAEYLKKLFVDRFRESNRLFFATQSRNRSNYEVLLGLIGYLLLFATYIILLYPLSHKVITIGFYIATISAVSRLVDFITKSLPQSLQYLFESHLYWQEVNTFFALSEQDKHCNQVKNVDCLKELADFQQIRFDDVYFKYPNSDQYILKGVSFTIEQGKHYAIVGKNGAGKSTLIKLLTGLYPVERGQITIDGVNLQEFSTAQIAQFFSVVFQDYGRYQIAVGDNIQLGRINATPDWAQMDAIAQRLDLLGTIRNLPQGYETILGKLTAEGIDLSGGEWQKLALCRSIYSNATLRILDEPTAALDPAAESKLYRLFEESLTAGATTIFISHRLGSTKLADEIILIDQGVVKEQGSHAKLIGRGGLYRQMFEAQKSWYGEVRDYQGGEARREGVR